MLIAGTVIVAMVLVAVAAPVISPYDPNALHYGEFLKAPGGKYALGTDNFGRDILSRIFWGARISLVVGVFAVTLAQIGAVVGITSGYFGGKLDIAAQRLVDVWMSFPALVLALALVAALGASLQNIVIAIALVQWPRVARIVRAAAMSVSKMSYIEAAQAVGCSDARILWRHVFPQCLTPILVVASVELPHAILVEAGLSFLGLGLSPQESSWGSMLAGEGRSYIAVAPWIGIFPGLAISAAVLSLNVIGDAVRDILDPRLRGG